MTTPDLSSIHLWHLVTRLGEAQILLPAALLALLLLLRNADSRPLAVRWWLMVGTAALLTTASKVAFIGWGIGSSELNFTGISGHSMFAAAVYPLLFDTLASNAPHWGRRFALLVGCVLALLVGVSRVMVGAHSGSEVLAGLLLGAAVTVAASGLVRRPPVAHSLALPVVTALWLAVMTVYAPASRSHATVTQLALMLSGHTKPYARSDMLRDSSRSRSASGIG